MKHLLPTIILALTILFISGFSAFAQSGTIKGRVIDGENGEPLLGANVRIEGTTIGAVTDINGYFTIEGVPTGGQTIVISFIGYEEQHIDINVTSNTTVDLKTIHLTTSAVGLEEVQVIASIAIDRETPVATSSIRREKIMTQIGNQEFPEILRFTPSTYVTKSGGGFGDSRINVRGFDQRNTAVMINGIPINDMENGLVYWSNWAGLTDVASFVQVQRGLGASKLAVPSVGGSINIITNAAEMEKGGAASISVGNDMYQKYSANYSTGLSENGWAFTFQGSHTRGDGYVNGTKFRAWSYFASVAKVFNEKHSINFTVLGAPQWHNQRSETNSYQQYQTYGTKYNREWGYLDGEEFNMSKNFYHKPMAFFNHYWSLSDKTDLATSVYASIGRGGGTGDLGGINGNDYFGLPRTDEGLLRIEDIKNWNQGGSVPDFGPDNVPEGSGLFAGQFVGREESNGIIRRASMNEHNWFGLISNLTHELSETLTLNGGIDARYYKGIHYRRVEDLLGLSAYLDQADINDPQHYVTEEGRSKDNIIAYYNDGLVNWFGLYGQLEYARDAVSAFLSVSGSNQGFKRVDYFNYLDSDPEQESGWQNFLGGTMKAGINYNINANNNVFVNGGYFSRQPIFDNIFPFFTNEVNEEAKNQAVSALEVGYGYRASGFRANVNLYHTYWGNRQFDEDVDANNDGEFDERAVFDDVSEVHQGLELDFVYSLFPDFNINGMLSVGNWRYTDNFNAVVLDENQNVLNTDVLLYMEDVKVGDAAQTTWSIGIDYTFLRDKAQLYSTFYRASDLYAAFEVNDEFLSPGNQVWKLPAYNLLDLGASYSFSFEGVELKVLVNVNNVLDQEYISESATNQLFNPADPADKKIPDSNGSINNGVYYGFGSTWNAGIRVSF